MALYNPEREVEERDVASEETVPAPIRPAAMYFRGKRYYGHDRPIGIYVGGTDRSDLVPAADIVCKDLSSWSSPPEGKVAVDVRLGRMMFETAPDDDVFVAYSYGSVASIGGGPYDRRVDPTGAVQSLGTVARPDSLDRLIRIPDDFPDPASAIASWDPLVDPKGVIQIDDSRTYSVDLNLNVGRGRLVIQAKNGQRPCLQGRIQVRGDADAGRFDLDGLLFSGHLWVGARLNHLHVAHCTLVPGIALDEDEGRPLRPDRPSVAVDADNDRVSVEIEASIVGPLEVPAEARGLRVRDSIIDSPMRSAPAAYRPALVSGRLATFSGLSSPTPTIEIRAGEIGPITVAIEDAPTTIGGLGDELESAVRNAHESPTFRRARVVGVPGSKRLILLSGTSTPIVVTPVEDDPTAHEMRMDEGSSYPAPALIGDRLDSVALSAATVELAVGTTRRKPINAGIETVPTTVAQARASLQNVIRSLAGGRALARALVARAENRLIVVSGAEDEPITLGTTETDRSTLFELGLHVVRPAVGSGDGGFGPATNVERTTIFGGVRARTIDASEVIFTEPVFAERRQRGCVRFSFVPEGSLVPRRYRCQPDLALEGVSRERDKRTGIERLQPSFTSIHYGDAAYAQLSLNCANEIRRGAEGGSEMGAFQHLREPQREANLHIRLEEYLPFGLEAGVIYVS